MEISPLNIDYREPQTTISHLALRLGDNCLPNQSRKYGDLWWDTEVNSYGVELKSCSDLLNSLWSKDTGERLEGQLDGLRRLVDVPILGIHGIWWVVSDEIVIAEEPIVARDGRGLYTPLIVQTKYTASSIDAFLWSITNTIDDNPPIRVLWRATKEQLLDAIISIYYNSAKEVHNTFQRVLTQGNNESADIRVLLAIPGIGEQRARSLLSKFGTPLATFLATDKELLMVPDIGAGAVKSIRKTIGGCNA